MLTFVIIDGIARIIYIFFMFYDLFWGEAKENGSWITWLIVNLIVATVIIYMFIVNYSLYKTVAEENSVQNQQVAYEAPTNHMQKAICEV